MPQLEFEFFWHQYFWVSIVFIVSLYLLSENFLVCILSIKNFRTLKLESLEQENDFTIDPVSESFLFDTVFTPIFYSNYSITKDFYKLFIKTPTSNYDLHSLVYSFKLYSINYKFKRYIYNTYQFTPIYYLYLDEQTKIAIINLKNKIILNKKSINNEYF